MLDKAISPNQTAYMKGRMINDNIRSLNAALKLANMEESMDALLVSLDAKKAFDSVEHSYIEQCLIKFGLEKFVPIFRILYKDLRTDIIINGQIAKGFKIKRGVKQGDALSCIIFILCMEPLLRNLERNPEIAAVNSTTLNESLPKAFAYADDVSCLCKNDRTSLQAIFKEYERLTSLSGLELNAEKTELLKFASADKYIQAPPVISFNISYQGNNYDITSKTEVKINGCIF